MKESRFKNLFSDVLEDLDFVDNNYINLLDINKATDEPTISAETALVKVQMAQTEAQIIQLELLREIADGIELIAHTLAVRLPEE